MKLSINNNITIYENALELAKLINLEDPILKSLNPENQVINNPEDLFYKGSKILSQEIIYLKKLLIKLENEQFNYEFILNKSFSYPFNKITNIQYFLTGLLFGLILSLVIIFFRNILKNN